MKKFEFKKRRRKKPFNPTQEELDQAKTVYFLNGGKTKRIDPKKKSIESILNDKPDPSDVDGFFND